MLKKQASSANATNGGLLFRLGNSGTLGTTGSTTINIHCFMVREIQVQMVVYGDGYDIGTLCQNMSSNEDMTTSGMCTFMNI